MAGPTGAGGGGDCRSAGGGHLAAFAAADFMSWSLRLRTGGPVRLILNFAFTGVGELSVMPA